MTLSLAALGVRSVVLDIEGTTTPVDFVYSVLFPYARTRATGFLDEGVGSAACQEAVALLVAERAAEPDDRVRALDVPAYVQRLMNEDRKSRGLKMLQGLIWDAGFRQGDLVGEVYPDVAPALARWTAAGVRVFIYSSGSVLAQRLLFGHSRAGDLTSRLSGYFDTAIGPKTSAASYRAVVAAIGPPAAAVLFLSDVVAELDAAVEAGMQVRHVVRPGTRASDRHPAIETFDALGA